MKKLNLFIITVTFFALQVPMIPAQSAKDLETIYTDLATEKCKTTDKHEEELRVVTECAGVADYKLEVYEYDERQTISIIFSDGKKHGLNFHKVVHPSFSYVGAKAEWRVVKEGGQIKPIALIVRFNARVDLNSNKDTSFLTVAKISENSACVTDVVKPAIDQNVKARQLADSSAEKPCLKEYSWLPEDDS